MTAGRAEQADTAELGAGIGPGRRTAEAQDAVAPRGGGTAAGARTAVGRGYVEGSAAPAGAFPPGGVRAPEDAARPDAAACAVVDVAGAAAFAAAPAPGGVRAPEDAVDPAAPARALPPGGVRAPEDAAGPATRTPGSDVLSSGPRFVALGDSLTQGVGDRVGDRWRGWAALLADGLSSPDAPAEFHNLAVSGALTQDVAERQVPQALALRPDIASVVVGVNDTLRCTFDIEDLTRRLDAVCAALAARGTVLLTACLPDPGSMLALPTPLTRPLARRQRAVNAVVHALSDRYGAVHLHGADASWVADRSMWSADRLHPGERGHRTIARRFHELLAARGLAHGTPPGCEPDQPAPTRSASLLWLATAGTGWLARRCTDLLPQLLQLAGAEVRHWARGTSARLDRSADLALSSALAAVSLDVPLARMGE